MSGAHASPCDTPELLAQVRAIARRTRIEQGLTAQVTDPRSVERIVALLERGEGPVTRNRTLTQRNPLTGKQEGRRDAG